MANITILLADDHPIVRSGMRNILESHPDLRLVGEVDHGATLEAAVRELQPDVLLLDLNMPELDPVAMTQRLVAGYPHLKVLVLTAHDNAEYMVDLLAAGAAGYALKDEATDSLVTAIRSVARGETWFTDRVARQLARKLSERPPAEGDGDPLQSLTPRELEVLTLIGQGASNRDIARALHISKRTVETYVHRIYLKLGLQGRSHAVLYAVERGLVDGRSKRAL